MAIFRTAVFDACKLLSKDNSYNSIRSTIHSLRVCEGSDFNAKQDIACNGLRINAEFYGILLAFEKGLLSVPSTQLSKAELTDGEKNDLYYGNELLSSFADECLREIAIQAPNVAKAIHPYGLFAPISPYSCEEKVDITTLQPAVSAFKEISVYKTLLGSNALSYLNTIPQDQLIQLILVLDRDIIKNPGGSTANDILALKIREKDYKPNTPIPAVDALQIISFKLLALKEMLANAVKLFFGGILGEDLIVIKEDNLINIEQNTSDVIYTYKTVLLQGYLFTPFSELLKSIVLLHIKNSKADIHEFGSVRSATISFACDDGETTKLTLCKVDDDLNPLFNLTK